MPPIRADLNSSNFEVRPAGDYPAHVVGYKRTACGPNAKNPGATMVEVEFKLDPPNNGKQWTNLVMVPNALFRTKQFFVACGIPEEEVGGSRDIGFRDEFAGLADDDLLDPLYLDDYFPRTMGCPVVLEVGVREYNGEQRNEVKRVKNPSEALVGAGSGSGW